MASSLLLMALSPASSDASDPLDVADCTKRSLVLPPFGVITTTYPSSISESTTPTTAVESPECDASIHTTGTGAGAGAGTNQNHTLVVARQWTGTPIRAMVPLPRRNLRATGTQDKDKDKDKDKDRDRDKSTPHLNVQTSTVRGPSPRSTRSIRVWDDAVDTDSGAEDEDEDAESDEDSDAAPAPASRCFSYESITAAQGLSAWSFEVRRAYPARFSFSESLGLNERLGTACRMLRPILRRQRYQAAPRCPACSCHPTCFRSPFHHTDSLNLAFAHK